jgi:lipid-binding SYLF domain-containing protein
MAAILPVNRYAACTTKSPQWVDCARKVGQVSRTCAGTANAAPVRMRTTSMMLALSLVCAACTTAELEVAEPPSGNDMAAIDETVAQLKSADPDIQRFFQNAYGYVVFPSVGKGGLLVGGAHGTGWVYEKGQLVGEAKLNQLAIGALAGGQSFSEVIFFRDPVSLNAFKAGKTELGAEVSAVVLKERASTGTGYDPNGMAIFVLPKGGVMAEASVGGQKFSFEPMAE